MDVANPSAFTKNIFSGGLAQRTGIMGMIGKNINRGKMLNEAIMTQGAAGAVGAGLGILSGKLQKVGQGFSLGKSTNLLQAEREAGIKLEGQTLLKEFSALNKAGTVSAALMAGGYGKYKNFNKDGKPFPNLMNKKQNYQDSLEIQYHKMLKSADALVSGKKRAEITNAYEQIKQNLAARAAYEKKYMGSKIKNQQVQYSRTKEGKPILQHQQIIKHNLLDKQLNEKNISVKQKAKLLKQAKILRTKFAKSDQVYHQSKMKTKKRTP